MKDEEEGFNAKERKWSARQREREREREESVA